MNFHVKLIVSLLLICGCGIAEEKPKPAPAETKVTVPKLTDAQRAEIREKQIALDETVLQMRNLKDQYDQAQATYNTVRQQVLGAIAARQEEVDKDKKVWVLNPATLVFDPVPAPKPPEEKK